MSDATGYEVDFYAWANEQAALLRAGRFGTADIDNIAEELESMGRSEKRELISRLTVLLTHLLKWRFQPERSGSGWRATIRIQRRDLADHLADNPSLKTSLPKALNDSFERSVIIAADETGIPEAVFPTTCPWTWAQIMDEDFWPEG